MKFTAVDMILLRRIYAEASVATYIYAVFIIMYAVFFMAAEADFNPWVVTCALMMVFFSWLKFFLSVFRIMQGFFGNSDYEIRELLKYVVNSASSDDLIRGGTQLLEPNHIHYGKDDRKLKSNY